MLTPDDVKLAVTEKRWLTKKVDKGLWVSDDFVTGYLKWLADELCFQQIEDWYNITRAHFNDNYGGSLLCRFNGSPSAVVKYYFANYDWKGWLFSTAPRGYFDDHVNRIAYLNWLKDKLGYGAMEDWYSVSSRDFIYNCGSALMTKYGNSHIELLKDCYSEYEWLEWKFAHISRRWWRDVHNVRRYLTWLSDILILKTPIALLTAKTTDISANNGAGLIQMFGGWKQVLKFAYPEIDWDKMDEDLEFKALKPIKKASWHDTTFVTKYFSNLAKTLEISSPEDWYKKLKKKELRKLGGIGLLSEYPFISQALEIAYPGTKFYEWLFVRVTPYFWASRQNRIDFLEWFGKLFSIQTPQDWYYVSRGEFIANGGTTLLFEYSSICNVLNETYDHYKWDPSEVVSASKRQNRLYKIVSSIFPEYSIDYNEKRKHGLRFESTRAPIEIDIYIHDLAIAIEYQGIQHSEPVEIYGGEKGFEKVQFRDTEKARLISRSNITLIYVTDMWNGSSKEIIDLLHSKKLINDERAKKALANTGIYPVDPYQRYEDAKAAVERLGITSAKQYSNEYNKDPRLVSSPQTYYRKLGKGFWIDFLEKEQKNYYPSATEALQAAKNLGLTTPQLYMAGYKADPRLPAAPHRKYKAGNNFGDFLQIDRKSYYNYDEAKNVVRKLEIVSTEDYRQKYYADERLPSNPERYYKGIGWIDCFDFYGTRKPNFYSTIKEASAAAQHLGLKTKEVYCKRRKEDERLPSSPNEVYAKSWKGWRAFLNMKV